MCAALLLPAGQDGEQMIVLFRASEIGQSYITLKTRPDCQFHVSRIGQCSANPSPAAYDALIIILSYHTYDYSMICYVITERRSRPTRSADEEVVGLTAEEEGGLRVDALCVAAGTEPCGGCR